MIKDVIMGKMHGQGQGDLTPYIVLLAERPAPGACMAKLTKSELVHHRAWLSDWRTPADMAAYVSAVNAAMGSADFFRQGGVEFLRDAWLAAEFGLTLSRLTRWHGGDDKPKWMIRTSQTGENNRKKTSVDLFRST